MSAIISGVSPSLTSYVSKNKVLTLTFARTPTRFNKFVTSLKLLLPTASYTIMAEGLAGAG